MKFGAAPGAGTGRGQRGEPHKEQRPPSQLTTAHPFPFPLTPSTFVLHYGTSFRAPAISAAAAAGQLLTSSGEPHVSSYLLGVQFLIEFMSYLGECGRVGGDRDVKNLCWGLEDGSVGMKSCCMNMVTLVQTPSTHGKARSGLQSL